MGRISDQFRKNQFSRVGQSIILISCFMCVTCGYMAAAQEVGTLLDQIAALVDSEPILLSDIQARLHAHSPILISTYPKRSEDSKPEQVLQDLINTKLVLKSAQEYDIEVTPEEIEAQIDKILQSNQANREQLHAFLTSQRKTWEDYKRDLKEQMVFMRFKGRFLIPKVKITDQDIESYYVRTHGRSVDAMSVSFRQILFHIPVGMHETTVSQKKQLCQTVYTKLQNGSNFEDLEKIYSDQEDGRLGKPPVTYSLQELSPNLRIALEGLEVGKFSAPIETSAGLHIFWLINKKFTLSSDYYNTKKQLEQELRESEMRKQLEEWLAKARMKFQIKILPLLL